MPLQNIINFRDIGQTINRIQSNHNLRERRIYRSARPDDASKLDREALTSKYQIASIIDLCSTTEHIDQAAKRNAQAYTSAALPWSNDAGAEPLKIPGIRYHEINLNGGSFARALLWKLRWSSLGKLVGLMALGYRMDAISILGREVMAPRGLAGLGKDSLDHCTSELQKIFTALAHSSNYPILIHCTQGKDRTGLVVILLLLLLGVPMGAISADYTASENELECERQSRMDEIRRVGLGEEFAACPAGFAQEIAGHLQDLYGGVNGYLTRIGVDEETQDKIKENMLEA
ncbi:MAG: hypothetical protein ALECFALPRED_007530 [Alectoria fallacina]|uniref:Tyrosine specific protein phosphatases domain-containing protein n=1 Tax=Alectoria fallacina TaxID=1903189 RepID=A0A8H3HVQ2_9LECA|nr:MAG: hypothetical protein ALECFALPRED_007530 [Alectoria fallacina]